MALVILRANPPERLVDRDFSGGRQTSTTTEPLALAIDLGGTWFRVAAISRGGDVVARLQRPTAAQRAAEEVVRDLCAGVREIRDQVTNRQIVGLGVSAPGPLDPEAGVIIEAPGLPQWRNVPLTRLLEEELGLSVALGNDANLAALGEARCGAGRGAAHLVYLTVSTGVGGGMIVDGRLLLGVRGLAGESGHMNIWPDGAPCGCGNRGCLEAYASGAGLVRLAHDAIAAGRPTELVAHGADLRAVDIAESADRGDPLARELFHQAGTALGIGVRNLLHLFNPSAVVIGGGVSRAGAILWEPMLAVVDADRYGTFRSDARILQAELGDDPGLVGAGLFAHDRFGDVLMGAPATDPSARIEA